ncbi:hypothetical protein PINS_up012465 [Pythium insidiosum]|nr:hypothetical protein PINS_up012465 [Pythium insidiosum]
MTEMASLPSQPQPTRGADAKQPNRRSSSSSSLTQTPVPPPTTRHAVLQSTLHLSPRKFHRLQQQQRNAVLRGMLPLSPLTPRQQQQQQPNSSSCKASSSLSAPSVVERCDPVPWNPAWLPVTLESAVQPAVATLPPSMVTSPPLIESALPTIGTTPRPTPQGVSYAAMTLDAWLQRFEQDVLQFESLEAFAQVKVAEALAFCEKMELHIEQQAQLEAERPLNERAASTAAPATVASTSATTGSSSASAVAPPLTAMSRFPARFRIAVFASLVERTVLALTQSAALGHLKPLLLQARQELFRAVFADYDPPLVSRRRQRRTGVTEQSAETAASDSSDGDDSDPEDDEEEEPDDEEDTDDVDAAIRGTHAQRRASRLDLRRQRRLTQQRARRRMMQHPSVRLGPETPRTLGFFLSRIPFALKLQEDSQRRAVRFQRHQVVLRRIIQSMYRSLGSVFHAWKIHVRQKREERLNEKGAQLTAMVVMQRGLVRTIFVEWSKVTLKAKLRRLQDREIEVKQKHDERINALYKELFVLREQNNQLHEQLRIARGELLVSPEERAQDTMSDEDEETVAPINLNAVEPNQEVARDAETTGSSAESLSEP